MEPIHMYGGPEGQKTSQTFQKHNIADCQLLQVIHGLPIRSAHNPTSKTTYVKCPVF